MLIGKSLQGHVPARIGLSDGAYFFPGQFGVVVRDAFPCGVRRDAKHSVGVGAVLAKRDDFEVPGAVVGLDAVAVVDGHSGWDWAVEGVGNQSVSVAHMRLVIHAQQELSITGFIDDRLSEPAGAGACAWRFASDVSGAADFVMVGELADWKPDFVHGDALLCLAA